MMRSGSRSSLADIVRWKCPRKWSKFPWQHQRSLASGGTSQTPATAVRWLTGKLRENLSQLLGCEARFRVREVSLAVLVQIGQLRDVFYQFTIRLNWKRRRQRQGSMADVVLEDWSKRRSDLSQSSTGDVLLRPRFGSVRVQTPR
jgi:hypothetical protein